MKYLSILALFSMLFLAGCNNAVENPVNNSGVTGAAPDRVWNIFVQYQIPPQGEPPSWVEGAYVQVRENINFQIIHSGYTDANGRLGIYNPQPPNGSYSIFASKGPLYGSKNINYTTSPDGITATVIMWQLE